MPAELPVVEIIFDKENFESHIDADNDVYIEDAQWSDICSDLEGRLWNYFEELINSVVQDYKEGKYDEPKDPSAPKAVIL